MIKYLISDEGEPGFNPKPSSKSLSLVWNDLK